MVTDEARRLTRFGLTYAQSRLRLGILGVGLWVVVALAVLISPKWANSDTLPSLLGYLILSLPLDLLGGQILPRMWQQATLRPGVWLSLYVRGVVLHSAFLLLGPCVLNIAYGAAGLPLAVGLYGLGSLLLLGWQVTALRALGIRLRQEGGQLWLEARDPRFSGGPTGFPFRELMILPAHWQGSSTSGWRLHLERHRRLSRGAARGLGSLLGIAYNALGLLLLLPYAEGRWLVLVSSMTLWSFLGLLILPSLSRPGVLYADALSLGACRAEKGDLLTWLGWLEGLQEEDPERPLWVERIFHPIPSWNLRQRALAHGKAGFWPWNVARTALLTSSLSGSLLSRAVHCNSGRPELWFWPPHD